MAITSDLEINRAKELDELLTVLQPKIIQYIDNADPSSKNYRPDSLGTYHEPEYLKSQFFTGDGNDLETPVNTEELFQTIDKVLQYSVNTWNPGFLDKLYASTNPVGVVSDLILSVLNTNSHVYTVSPVLSVIENYVGKKYANLFYNLPTCGGLTFSGGSWSNITSLQIARSMKFPETKLEGNNNHKFAIYTSQHCHYSVEKAAILLGIGSNNVFKVKIHDDGSMNVDDLEATIERTIKEGYVPLYINSTAGTTVFGSYDPFVQIGKVAKKYKIHFHVDGSWGGNIIFSNKEKYKLEGIDQADSITVNPHKMLGIPTTCSFLLLPQVKDFQTSMSLKAPYLFHGRENSDENYDLADGTMGCGRRADAFKFYMGWLYYGTKGFESRVDHAYEIMNYFVASIKQDKRFNLVIDNPQCLQVCFYYKYEGYDKVDKTAITRYISRELHKQGKYLVDFSPNTTSDDGQGEFFRVVFNSPILTDKVVDDLIASIISAGDEFKKINN
jgi:glutamate decarboxylase